MYVMEWTSAAINIWFFPPTGIPESLSALDPSYASSSHPDPSTFGAPSASFSGPCSSSFGDKFFNHSIIIDTTFCGGWAGGTFGEGPSACPLAAGKSPIDSCVDYVAANPQAFEEAYWGIKSLRVWQKVAGYSTSSYTNSTGEGYVEEPLPEETPEPEQVHVSPLTGGILTSNETLNDTASAPTLAQTPPSIPRPRPWWAPPLALPPLWGASPSTPTARPTPRPLPHSGPPLAPWHFHPGMWGPSDGKQPEQPSSAHVNAPLAASIPEGEREQFPPELSFPVPTPRVGTPQAPALNGNNGIMVPHVSEASQPSSTPKDDAGTVPPVNPPLDIWDALDDSIQGDLLALASSLPAAVPEVTSTVLPAASEFPVVPALNQEDTNQAMSGILSLLDGTTKNQLLDLLTPDTKPEDGTSRQEVEPDYASGDDTVSWMDVTSSGEDDSTIDGTDEPASDASTSDSWEALASNLSSDTKAKLNDFILQVATVSKDLGTFASLALSPSGSFSQKLSTALDSLQTMNPTDEAGILTWLTDNESADMPLDKLFAKLDGANVLSATAVLLDVADTANAYAQTPEAEWDDSQMADFMNAVKKAVKSLSVDEEAGDLGSLKRQLIKKNERSDIQPGSLLPESALGDFITLFHTISPSLEHLDPSTLQDLVSIFSDDRPTEQISLAFSKWVEEHGLEGHEDQLKRFITQYYFLLNDIYPSLTPEQQQKLADLLFDGSEGAPVKREKRQGPPQLSDADVRNFIELFHEVAPSLTPIDPSLLEELAAVFTDARIDPNEKKLEMAKKLSGYDDKLKTFIIQYIFLITEIFPTMSTDAQQQLIALLFDGSGDIPLLRKRQASILNNGDLKALLEATLSIVGPALESLDQAQLQELLAVFSDSRIDPDTKKLMMEEKLGSLDSRVKSFVVQWFFLLTEVWPLMTPDEQKDMLAILYDGTGAEPVPGKRDISQTTKEYLAAAFDHFGAAKRDILDTPTDTLNKLKTFILQWWSLMSVFLPQTARDQLINLLFFSNDTEPQLRPRQETLPLTEEDVQNFIEQLQANGGAVDSLTEEQLEELEQAIEDNTGSTSPSADLSAQQLEALFLVLRTLLYAEAIKDMSGEDLQGSMSGKVKRQDRPDPTGFGPLDAYIHKNDKAALDKWRFGVLDKDQRNSLYNFLAQATNCALSPEPSKPCLEKVSVAYKNIFPESGPGGHGGHRGPGAEKPPPRMPDITNSGGGGEGFESAGETLDTFNDTETPDPCPDCVVSTPPSKHYFQLVNPQWINDLRNFAIAAAAHHKAPGDHSQAYVDHIAKALKESWKNLDADTKTAILNVLAPCPGSRRPHCDEAPSYGHGDHSGGPRDRSLPSPKLRLGRRDWRFGVPKDNPLRALDDLPVAEAADASTPAVLPKSLGKNGQPDSMLGSQITPSENVAGGDDNDTIVGELPDYSDNSIAWSSVELDDDSVDEASPELVKILDAQDAEAYEIPQPESQPSTWSTPSSSSFLEDVDESMGSQDSAIEKPTRIDMPDDADSEDYNGDPSDIIEFLDNYFPGADEIPTHADENAKAPKVIDLDAPTGNKFVDAIKLSPAELNEVWASDD